MLSTGVTKLLFVTEAEYKSTTSTANMYAQDKYMLCRIGLVFRYRYVLLYNPQEKNSCKK
jgi:hypothetical protein